MSSLEEFLRNNNGMRLRFKPGNIYLAINELLSYSGFAKQAKSQKHFVLLWRVDWEAEITIVNPSTSKVHGSNRNKGYFVAGGTIDKLSRDSIFLFIYDIRIKFGEYDNKSRIRRITIMPDEMFEEFLKEKEKFNRNH